MSPDSEDRNPRDEPEYRVYRSGRGATSAGRARAARAARVSDAEQLGPANDPGEPGASKPAGASTGPGGPGRAGGAGRMPYTTYRSAPRGLIARLRGESDSEIAEREEAAYRRGTGARRAVTGPWWQRLRWRRVVVWVLGAAVGWVALSFVLFMISAQTRAGDVPAGAASQLTSAGPMLTSANTVLILGLDNRPTTGAGSKEGGLQSYNFSEKDANTDTIMLWRIGGGVSRRLSIPRDTLVDIPGLGESKINAAWAYGGPALALKVIKQFTGLQINHLIVIDLANFPKFIDDVGGVTVKTGRICSQISGGAANGGFTLNLAAGTHHLNGEQAMILARTRENSCDRAYSDLNREAAQQQILNGIKSQLLTLHTFFNLPWAAWDAPGVVQTDMGGLTLMQLFISSELGGSAPSSLLTETDSTYGGESVLVPNAANVHAQVEKLLHG